MGTKTNKPEPEHLLNKYFWEPDLKYLERNDMESYNQALLLVDHNGSYTDKPFFLETNNEVRTFLYDCFSTLPLHKTNRIAINTESTATDEDSLSKTITNLISNSIKPNVILIFCEKVADFFKSNYKADMLIALPESDCWKGLFRIGSKYFYIYSLPNILKNESLYKNAVNFVNSTRIYDFKTISHLNYILRKIKDFSFPENPLTDEKIIAYLKNMPEDNFFSLPNLYPKNIKNILERTEKIDEYDVLITTKLTDFIGISSHSIDLNLKDYLQLRKNKTAKQICYELMPTEDISHSIDIINLSLIRLYLFVHYPVESFDYKWENEI